MKAVAAARKFSLTVLLPVYLFLLAFLAQASLQYFFLLSNVM
jgi:hypothetical protein